MTVTFFGHRSTPDSVKPLLKKVLRELINQDGAKMFYIGNEGRFDRMAYDVLKELKEEYPFIDYKVVLAYLERRKKDIKKFSPWETVFPDELTKTPPRFAIAKRNRIMLGLPIPQSSMWRDRAVRLISSGLPRLAVRGL